MFFPSISVAVITEQPLGGRAERLNDPALVDHDHRIRHGIQDRLQMGLPPESVARACGGPPTVAVQLLSAPRSAGADEAECHAVDDLRQGDRGLAFNHNEAKHDSECRRQQSGS